MQNQSFKYIDVHSHIHDAAFDSDRATVIEAMNDRGIATITIGTDLNTSTEAKMVAESSDNILYTIGVHPHDDINANFDYEEFAKLINSPKCVGVGECGLDYYFLELEIKKNMNNLSDVELAQKREVEKNRQKDLFIQQIKFALQHNKPLMLHGRPSTLDDVLNPTGMDAYIDMLDILNSPQISDFTNDKYELSNNSDDSYNMYNRRLRGNVHFFVGNIEIAKQFLELGFTFSLGGVLTITSEYDEVVKFLPIESIHAETDSPYVSPRGPDGKKVSQRNSPLNVEIIINKIAEIKNISVEDLRLTLFKNFIRDFTS